MKLKHFFCLLFKKKKSIAGFSSHLNLPLRACVEVCVSGFVLVDWYFFSFSDDSVEYFFNLGLVWAVGAARVQQAQTW